MPERRHVAARAHGAMHGIVLASVTYYVTTSSTAFYLCAHRSLRRLPRTSRTFTIAAALRSLDSPLCFPKASTSPTPASARVRPHRAKPEHELSSRPHGDLGIPAEWTHTRCATPSLPLSVRRSALWRTSSRADPAAASGRQSGRGRGMKGCHCGRFRTLKLKVPMSWAML